MLHIDVLVVNFTPAPQGFGQGMILDGLGFLETIPPALVLLLLLTTLSQLLGHTASMENTSLHNKC